MILHVSYGMPGWMPPPPQKKYIVNQQTNSGEHFEMEFKLDIYFKISNHFLFIVFYSYFFFPLVETSLIVGSMELKKITKNMVVRGFLTTTFQQ